jgi:Holliday junction resolvase RusA-like endonuclease
LNAEDLRRLFEKETGQIWNDHEGKAWLSKNREHIDLYFKESRLAKKCHIHLSDKINWLSQLSCHICNPNFPICIIPIRIPPESFQSLNKINRRAFKDAIRSVLSSYEQLMNVKICLHILFVCTVNRRTRDIDNMAKLLIDAIKVKVMSDDKDIDHLSIVRLSHEFDEEFIYIKISNSNLNVHDDVAAKEFNHSWEGKKALLLSDFYQK